MAPKKAVRKAGMMDAWKAAQSDYERADPWAAYWESKMVVCLAEVWESPRVGPLGSWWADVLDAEWVEKWADSLGKMLAVVSVDVTAEKWAETKALQKAVY